MPIGSYANLYYIAKELENKKPKTVLDLGIGFGMNGVLVRQYVDMVPSNYNTQLVGVEAFNNYQNPVWYLYNLVIPVTINVYIDFHNSDHFDFILMTDVIEHFKHTEGYEIINQLIKMLNPGGVLLISTPGVFVEQGAVHGNELERHLSFWKIRDFPIGFTVIKSAKPDHHGDETLIVKYVKP